MARCLRKWKRGKWWTIVCSNVLKTILSTIKKTKLKWMSHFFLILVHYFQFSPIKWQWAYKVCRHYDVRRPLKVKISMINMTLDLYQIQRFNYFYNTKYIFSKKKNKNTNFWLTIPYNAGAMIQLNTVRARVGRPLVLRTADLGLIRNILSDSLHTSRNNYWVQCQ